MAFLQGGGASAIGTVSRSALRAADVSPRRNDPLRRTPKLNRTNDAALNLAARFVLSFCNAPLNIRACGFVASTMGFFYNRSKWGLFELAY
jgi:hypothetical protein